VYKLRAADEVQRALDALERANSAKHKKVCKALEQLASDPHHNSLQSHRFHSETGPNGEPMWQAYAENKTPSAWRILFYYPAPRQIKKAKKAVPREPTIVVYAILPHL